MKPFVEVKNLSVAFPTEGGLVRATDDISFSVARGETLAIVGESGSGKSVSSMAIMGLHNPKRTQLSGSVTLHREEGDFEVIGASEDSMRKVRGKSISMIFQDPMSSLHPYYTVGNQIMEGWLLHNEGGKTEARKRAIQMLDMVGIPDAAKRVDEYPHQFSGGMRQRVMIAMALVNNPHLIIADEPTTALDVTVQSQILNLLKEMQNEFNMAVILITHDLGVVAEVADRINVMYAGRLVEEGSVDEIFYRSQHPYTLGLLNSIPRVDEKQGARLSTIPGQPPSLIHLPQGCAFNPRCEYSSQVGGNLCFTEQPGSLDRGNNHRSRCHLPAQTLASLASTNNKGLLS
jgi:peptide/nickel transport system ATP-binding protein